MKCQLFIKIIVVFSCLLLTIFVPSKVAAESSVIAIDDSDFMNISNFAPGQSAVTSLKVTNNGEETIDYGISLNSLGGSQAFFEQLQVVVMVAGKEKYDGSFADLKEIDTGTIEGSETVPVDFEVTFPQESGNMYQGLSTQLSVTVHTKQQLEEKAEDSVVRDDKFKESQSGFFGSSLPETGDEIPFLHYLLGSLLIILGVVVYNRSKIVSNMRGRNDA